MGVWPVHRKGRIVSDHSDVIEIDGHRVVAARTDQFRHGSDGSRLTDAEWDEQQRRLTADNTDLVPPEFREQS